MSNKLLESIQVGRELREGTNYNSEYADERFNELINKVAEAVLESSDIVEVIDDGSSLDYESIEEYIDDPDGQGELNYASILSGSDLEFFNGFIDYWHVDVVEMETGPIKVLWVSHPVGDTFYIPRSSLDKINSGELIKESASNELSVGPATIMIKNYNDPGATDRVKGTILGIDSSYGTKYILFKADGSKRATLYYYNPGEERFKLGSKYDYSEAQPGAKYELRKLPEYKNCITVDNYDRLAKGDIK